MASALDGTIPAELDQLVAVAWLLAARVLPLIVLVPAFALRGAPAAWLVTALFALVAALLPSAWASGVRLPPDLFSLTLLSLRELTLGTLYAVALALPFWALDWGGRLIDQLRGANPSGRGPSALGDMYLWFAVAAFLALGGHRVVIAALAHGLRSHPLGAIGALGPGDGGAGALRMLALSSTRLVADALAAGLMVAAPVAAVLVLFEVALGVVARAAPAFAGVLALAPAKGALALAAVLMASAALSESLPGVFSEALTHARRLFEAAP